MRITRRQLSKLIETSLKEMAYGGRIGGRHVAPQDGVTGLVGYGEDVDEEGVMRTEEEYELDKEILNRYFSGRYFTDKSIFYFDKLPDRKVWIIPVMGTEMQTSDKVFGKSYGYHKDVKWTRDPFYNSEHADPEPDMTADERYRVLQRVPAIGDGAGSPADAGFAGSRSVIYNLSDSIDKLENLDVSDEDMSKIDVQNDTVFVVSAFMKNPDFLLTPWMIMHAIFDNVYPPRNMPVASSTEDYVSLDRGLLGYGMEERGKDIKLPNVDLNTIGTSASFRNNAIRNPNDALPELATQAFFYGGVKINPKYSNDPDVMVMVDIINKEANYLKNYLKGKIVQLSGA